MPLSRTLLSLEQSADGDCAAPSMDGSKVVLSLCLVAKSGLTGVNHGNGLAALTPVDNACGMLDAA